MSLLFCIDQYDNTVLHPDAIKLCPELRVLDDKEIAAIIYAYDYNSIYHQFPEAERIRRATVKVYGETVEDVFGSLKMKAAISAYMSLQYNPKIEFVNTCQLRIDGLQDDLISAKDERDISRILKSIDMLRKQIKELEAEVIGDSVKEGRIFGDGSLSFLEMFQKKKKAYDNLLNNKNK